FLLTTRNPSTNRTPRHSPPPDPGTSVLARAPKLFAIRIANNFEAEKTIKTGYVPFVTATDASQSDLQLYQEAMALAAMAEPLGFDSLWSLEHHFTGYAMTPSPVQFLSYF